MPTTLPAGARIKTTAKRRISLPGINAPTKKRRSYPEAEAQKKVIEWRDRNKDFAPALRWLHSSLNAAKRTPFQQRDAVAQGLTKGIPDLFLPRALCGYMGLYIEMKIAPNKSEPEQIEFLEAATEEGYLCRVCWSSEEAIKLIEYYLMACVFYRGDIADELGALRASYKAPKGVKA